MIECVYIIKGFFGAFIEPKGHFGAFIEPKRAFGAFLGPQKPPNGPNTGRPVHQMASPPLRLRVCDAPKKQKKGLSERYSDYSPYCQHLTRSSMLDKRNNGPEKPFFCFCDFAEKTEKWIGRKVHGLAMIPCFHKT